RMTHWRSVIVSACEQSGRARVPELSTPVALGHLAAQLADDMVKLTLDPLGDSTLATLAAPATHSVVIAIGPEGGWSPRDRQLLRTAGFTGLQLGPRILRTETAGLAAIAALQAR